MALLVGGSALWTAAADAPAAARRPAAHAAPCPLRAPHDGVAARRSVPCAPQQHGQRLVAAQVAKSRGSQDDADVHATKLGPGVIASIKDLDHVKWTMATVMRNDAVNLGGDIRLLHLSVPDHVDMLYGRRVKGVPDANRWIDAYTIPGQCIGVRLPAPSTSGGNGPAAEQPPAQGLPKQLYNIATSPYASRRDSAYVDASLIEVVVERNSGAEEARISELGPGAQVEVTQVIGRGFSPLLDSYNGLQRALEEGRSLLLIGMGTKGIAPMRALLNWQPLLAHASSHQVTVFYLVRCPGDAAFVAEWDSWRDAGIKVRPLYTEPEAAVEGQQQEPKQEPKQAVGKAQSSLDLDLDRVQELLEVALFASEGGFDGACGGNAKRASALLAGLPREVASKVAKQISTRGVDYEHILFCDYF